MKQMSLCHGQTQTSYCYRLVCLVSALSFLPWIDSPGYAQVPPITPSELNTQVNPAQNPPLGKTQFDITGGTRAGTNLFHSFGEFGVPANNIANFLNETAQPTSNILGRVTGGNVSNIFGAIQTQGFGSANLFLMNPAGFLFGQNATVNVGGMVTFTSADYLRLEGIGGNGIFHADTAQTSVLTSAPVAAFGFLGSNPGAITVQGSQFTVTEGTGISLVGGNITIQAGVLDDGITIQPARLSAPGGQINLASMASPGEVSVLNFLPEQSVMRGNIGLSQGATIDVSGEAAGTIRIRGGQLELLNSALNADTGEVNGASVAIDVNANRGLLIANDGTAALTARTIGSGDAGAIEIVSESLTATTSAPFPSAFSLIDSHTSGTGRAGNISLNTGTLEVQSNPSAPIFFIDSGTGGLGSGGDVSVIAENATFSNTGINTGDVLAGGSGSAGNLSIQANSLTLITSTLTADSLNARGGDVILEAHDISLTESSFIDVLSLEGGSAVHITADHLVLDGLSSILNQTALGSGGETSILAKTVEITNSSTVASQTFGDGAAGNIRIVATESIRLSDDILSGSNSQASGLFTNSLGDPTLGTMGNSGAIEINTPRLEITGGARINSTTQTSGRGGNVRITVSDQLTVSGERSLDVASELFGLGSTRASGIYTRTVGTEFCGGACGDAGNVNITAGSLTLQNGGLIDSGTINNGQGGAITVTTPGQALISGTMTDGTPSGIFSRTIGADPDAGSGGNISLVAGQSVIISNGAAISASSTGPGNTGNIQINAGNQFAMTNSTVTTEANQSSGGAIKITTTPSGTVQLTNSTISASVLDGTGGGGSVNIDPQFVVLQNSQILAQAVQGPGGNISITTNLLLPDANSVISASSQFGVNGTVTIQSPNAPASGKIQPLGKSPLLATTLLNQRCAALAGGQFSSFTVAGRDSLPAEPGSWLSSPLAALSVDARPAVLGEGLAVMPPGASLGEETALLSLRQIAPAGFLTQAFAVDWSAGCQS